MSDLYRIYDEVGADGYPPEWHETIKYAVRAAAGHRCIRCGHPYQAGDGEWSQCDEACTHGTPLRLRPADGSESIKFFLPEPRMAWALAMVPGNVEAQWRILTVHHLNGNKADCRWWNLVSLCQRCHLRVQRVVLMERVWPWEHSEWFRPYVAGYYASVYLGEELTREQAIERMEELLALERVA